MSEASVAEGKPRRFVAANGTRTPEGGVATSYTRLQNALVAWSEVAAAPAVLKQDAIAETVVVLPEAAAVLRADGASVEAPARSICILPAGASSIEAQAPGRVIRIFAPVPEALARLAVNAEDYREPRAGVHPLGAPLAYSGEPGIRVYPIDQFKAAAGRRPPSFQTATLNVMWIERDGPTDRTKLDPHSHDDFEEGALIVAGEYVEHLRTPWAADASAWREDEHVTCKPGTLIIVPPTVIHTTEILRRGPPSHAQPVRTGAHRPHQERHGAERGRLRCGLSSPNEDDKEVGMDKVNVRYIVDDVDAAIKFYTLSGTAFARS